MAGNIQVTISGLGGVAAATLGLKDSTQDKGAVRDLIHILRGVQNGTYPATVTAGVSTANAVYATGTLTMASSTGTVGASSIGGTSVTVTWATSDTLSAAALAAAINANTTVNKKVTATSAAGVVTIKANQPGEIGNSIALVATGTNVTASAATLTGGAGGQASPVVFSLS